MATIFTRAILSGAMAFFVLLSGSALAHHSAAMFDSEVELTLTGVVTKFDYLNPHSWLYINVTEEDGSVTEWGFEMSAPPLLRRAGIAPSTWQTGDLVRVKTNPLKDGRPAGSLRGIIKADGSSYRDTEGLEAPTPES